MQPHEYQMYIASDLHVPHYQISSIDYIKFLTSIQLFTNIREGTSYKIYNNKIMYTYNHFLTLIDGKHN